MKNASALWLLAALLLSASMWFYFDGVLVPYETQDAASRQQPRGNLSDLYPRWLGARELLLRGRNPYSAEITGEIQTGYYGRPLSAANPQDPLDQEGFAYPVYVVFLLAPTIELPFEAVRKGMNGLLWILTGISALLWLRAIGWKAARSTQIMVMILMLGSLPVAQGIKLQQLTLIVAALLAAASACVVAGQFVAGGILLALATIKPQLALLPIAWFSVWALVDWRRRQGLLWGLLGTLLLLVVGGEMLLPHWIPQFWVAVQKYHEYTHNTSIPGWLFGSRPGDWICAALILASLVVLRRCVQQPQNTAGFASGLALVLALTVLVVPMFAPYNQVLLAPVILLLIRQAQDGSTKERWVRGVYGIVAVAFAWPWIASLGLMLAAVVIDRESLLQAWKLPLFSVVYLPPLAFALILVDTWQSRGDSRARKSQPAEG